MKLNNKQAQNLNFNLSRIKKLRFFKKIVPSKLFIVLTVIIFLFLSFFIDYLSRTPRERAAQNFSYWQRVQYGLNLNYQLIKASLLASQDDPKNTSLPLLEIYLKKERLKLLTEHLPESGKIFQAGLFKVKQKKSKDLIFEAELRLRGDSMNHWAFPQKSWRVKLKKSERYLGMRQFNLYLPRSKSQIPDFLGYELAKRMGGLSVPEAFPTHFRLNRKFSGLRVFLEQINEDYILKNKIDADRILVGDIDFRDVYGTQKRSHLFQTVEGWEALQINPQTQTISENALQPIQQVIETIPLAEKNPNQFKSKIQELLDLESTLRYMAYLEIVNSAHVDDSHNQRFYYDMKLKKLVPIVWDPVAYYWGYSDRIDLCSNSLFRALLLIPEFRELKNKYIWQAINGELSTSKISDLILNSAEKIRPEIYASPQKIYTFSNNLAPFSNQEWEIAVKDLIKVSELRNQILVSHLSKNLINLAIVPENRDIKIRIALNGNAGVILENIIFKNKSNSLPVDSVQIKQNEVLRSIATELVANPKEISRLQIPIGDQLYTARIVKNRKAIAPQEMNYNYQILNIAEQLELEQLQFRNSVTGELFLLSPIPKGKI